MKIRILKTGLSCTFQDVGRRGYQHWGVPVSGPMDTASAGWLRYWLGNAGTDAALEIAPGAGWEAEVVAPGWLVGAGAGGQLWVNGQPITAGRGVYADIGMRLAVRATATGLYYYLAVPKGWEALPILGSHATCHVGQLGPAPVCVGQLLGSVAVQRAAVASATLHRGLWQTAVSLGETMPASVPLPIRVLPAPEWDWWTSDGRAAFFNQTYIKMPDSNRMGIRLQGQSVAPTRSGSLLSTGVVAGTLQVPPSGQPVVLMANAQTTGGFPRLVQVLAVDMPLLAQWPFGRPFQFVQSSEAEAVQLLRQQMGYWNFLAHVSPFAAVK